MHADIVIVIAAYNRPDSLQRLLDSVDAANYEGYATISLVISIDHSNDNACKTIADSFEWKQGTKTVIAHAQKLGLKKHLLSCGDYSQQHDAVIVLEDDLFVSTQFYQYAQQAYTFYKNEQQVAGVALYNSTFNEVAYCPFEPVHDGADIYFMQVPCSWGQLWTREQWARFKQYLATEHLPFSETLLPATVQLWPDASSWKKLFYRFLLETGSYFVYPRIGLSTNFGETGQHLVMQENVFQSAVLLADKTFRFSTLQESLSVYDGFFELDGIVYNKLVDADAEVSFDLNGSKPLSSIKTKYLISGKQCRTANKRFAVSFYPYENNILLDLQAAAGSTNYFSLAETRLFNDQQQFHRLPADFRRVFLSDVFIRQSVYEELKQTMNYRFGKRMLQPLRYLKQLLGR